MIAVIFEVNLKSDGMLEYFNIAAELATQLSEIDGFISIERFQSLNDQHRFVSLSFWKDEHAVQAWREQMLHRQA
ncbi:hypothetical protein GCM10007978_09020 [Shewanella hanedai]|nr:hypothetical protein GCM10007978_09020 [Shewanella hanedai]